MQPQVSGTCTHSICTSPSPLNEASPLSASTPSPSGHDLADPVPRDHHLDPISPRSRPFPPSLVNLSLSHTHHIHGNTTCTCTCVQPCHVVLSCCHMYACRNYSTGTGRPSSALPRSRRKLKSSSAHARRICACIDLDMTGPPSAQLHPPHPTHRPWSDACTQADGRPMGGRSRTPIRRTPHIVHTASHRLQPSTPQTISTAVDPTNVFDLFNLRYP